ncbi:hypothetical protein NLN92_14395 [Citrobacter portucalensis]|uniref:hypothetical protein n=1 Tax=Citrobacter portucalensis TaxID=1639133 RepID=UPI00226B73D2|nr:hypothetical protein [Citrobacter portucalensis]MCX8979199.1 hypothetical protein [Citrobacter portucalensis]
MAKKGQDADLGDVLDAVENASDQQLRELRAINKKLANSGLVITRSNAGPNASTGNQSKPVNMRAYNRNRDKLKSGDVRQAKKAAEDIANAAVKRAFTRDGRGRFASTNPPAPPKQPRAPRQPKGGSVWSQPPSKSNKAQQDKKADANREAVEEQTKETIQRQDETNDLLKELVKETRKSKKDKQQPIVSGGGGGLDLNVGKGGLFRRLGRKIFGRKGAKIAAGAAAAAGAAGIADNVANVATAKTGPLRDANGRFLSKAEREAAAVGSHGVEKMATKGGLKAVAKVGLKAIPILGTAIGAGMDAVQGWNDTEAQQATFGKNVSTRQKMEYTAANVADMGGLVSGTSSLLGQGADLLGFHDAAKAMTFTTADMARGVDGIGNKISDSWNEFKSSFTDDSADKEKNDEARNEKLISAIGMLGGTQGSAHNTSVGPAAEAVLGDKMSTLSGDVAQVTGRRTDGYTLGGKGATLRNKRNNNFGNLSYSGWVKSYGSTQAEIGNGGRFASFATPDEGIRAMATQLHRYGTGEFQNGAKGKLNTIRKAISTWAPGNENDTDGYIKGVSKALGVSPDAEINMDDPNVIEALSRAIAKQEGGDISMSSQAFQDSLGELKNGKYFATKTPEEIKKSIQTSGEIKIGQVTPVANPSGGGDSGGDNQYVDALKKAWAAGDKGIGNFMAEHGIGAGHVSSDLSLPAGAEMPASLRIKPATIAQTHDYGSLTNQPAAAGGTKPATPQQGSPGIIDMLRGSAADTFNWATQGISGSGILDSLMGGMNPMVADVLKPLTGAAGNKLDEWMGTGRSTITDMISGRPTVQKSVTDLAGSGATATVSQDNDTMKASNEQTDQLKLIVSHLEDLLGLTKDGQKNTGSGAGGGKNEATHSAQPGPSGDIPLASASKALLQMIEGVL